MKILDASDIVFVYGALRSGTTVFRLMLDAHPQIANPGEMDFLFDYLSPDTSHPTGWRYDVEGLSLNRIFQNKDISIVDGLDGLDLLEAMLDQLRARHKGQELSINIHRHLDRILAVMPTARVIHMLRDPRDVARSSVVMGWAGNSYYGVDHWLETEAEWDVGVRQAAQPEIMTLTYEDLFTKTNEILNAVCGFFKVPYNSDMLNYHEGSTYAPPDPSLIQQWRKKADPKDMAFLESKAAEMMTKRGYAPELPSVTVGLIDRLKLAFGNKVSIWKFGLKRYGAYLFIGEKVTRVLRLKTLHKSMHQGINQIQRAAVK